MANVKRKERRIMRYVTELKYREALQLHDMLRQWVDNNTSFESFHTDIHTERMELAAKLIEQLQRELAGS